MSTPLRLGPEYVSPRRQVRELVLGHDENDFRLNSWTEVRVTLLANPGITTRSGTNSERRGSLVSRAPEGAPTFPPSVRFLRASRRRRFPGPRR